MTENPLVSVIAVCYNHARFVIECLDSIRNQTYPNLQIIIMDDCSTDDSVERIYDWINDNKIECKIIVHSQNKGVCKTFNEALEYAQGRYISLIATDDTWLPDKITRQVAIMEAMPENVGVVYSDAYQMDENGQRLPDMFIAAHRKFDSAPEGNLREHLIYSNFIPAMTTLIRCTVYERVGLYDESLAYEDWDFWLRAANHFHFAYSDFPSANYRVLNTSMMRTLLSNRNAATNKTFFQIHKKILAMSGISQSSRRLTAERLSSNARFMYAIGDPEAPHALINSFMVTKQFFDLYCALLGFLGISHKRYQRALSYLRWRLSSLSIPGLNKERRK